MLVFIEKLQFIEKSVVNLMEICLLNEIKYEK